MLREDYIRFAASVHVCGARMLRDSAAALFGSCTLQSVKTAFALQKTVADSEELMRESLRLGAGLLESGTMSKYTVIAEARMRLAGVELSGELSGRQSEVERIHEVPPGTRADVYNGFIALSERGARVADNYLRASETLMGDIKEGRTVFAVPMGALEFLHRLCADYGAACRKLAESEEACLVCRPDALESYKKCLMYAAAANGVNSADSSSDALAALSSGGLIPGIAPVLFDILLRYESLPPALR